MSSSRESSVPLGNNDEDNRDDKTDDLSDENDQGLTSQLLKDFAIDHAQLCRECYDNIMDISHIENNSKEEYCSKTTELNYYLTEMFQNLTVSEHKILEMVGEVCHGQVRLITCMHKEILDICHKLFKTGENVIIDTENKKCWIEKYKELSEKFRQKREQVQKELEVFGTMNVENIAPMDD